jgi:cell division transport system permease protein
VSAWLRAHLQAARRALARLFAEPGGTLLSVAVIAGAMALPLFLHALVSNATSAAKHLATDPTANIYFKPSADDAAVRAVEKQLKGHPAVNAVRFISRDEALAEMKNVAGMGEVFASLDSNPLPHTLAVKLATRDATELAALKSQVSSIAGVEDVAMDFEWAEKLNRAARFLDRLMWLLAAGLGLAVVFVLGNTIRLQILTQKEEIAVCRLIGASNAYIRRPFLYQGAMQGALAGLLAVGVTIAGVQWASREIRLLTASYGGFDIAQLDAQTGWLTFALAAALGWLGAYFSASRHLAGADR